MFLLRRLQVVRLVQRSGCVAVKKPGTFKSYAQSRFARGFHSVCRGECTPKFWPQISRCCKYSSEVNEVQERFEAESEVDKKEEDNVEEIFSEIAKDDPQLMRKLQLLQFEIEVLRQSNGTVPDSIKKNNWEHLLTLNTVGARKKYLVFLFKNEKRAYNRRIKKEASRKEYLKFKEENEFDPLQYRLCGQSLLLRVYSKTVHNLLHFKNELSEEVAQQIVFDCSYQEYMGHINTSNTASQLMHCLNVSTYHQYPSQILLCNLNKTDQLHQELPRHCLNVYDPLFPWQVTEESYLDFYPKKNLVYLTPHCNEPLTDLQPGDVYIIGAFVDKGCSVKASLARAKKHKLRMARLPLDEHLQWTQGHKSLPLNIVLKIMLDMKLYRDWKMALKNIPSRHCGLSLPKKEGHLDKDFLV